MKLSIAALIEASSVIEVCKADACAPGVTTAIKLVDQVAVLIFDTARLTFQRGGHLAFLDREFLRQQSDAAHAFIISEVRRDRRNVFLHHFIAAGSWLISA